MRIKPGGVNQRTYYVKMQAEKIGGRDESYGLLRPARGTHRAANDLRLIKLQLSEHICCDGRHKASKPGAATAQHGDDTVTAIVVIIWCATHYANNFVVG